MFQYSNKPQASREERPAQSVEKSAGYISWSLKEISESLKKMIAMMESDRGDNKNPNPPF